MAKFPSKSSEMSVSNRQCALQLYLCRGVFAKGVMAVSNENPQMPKRTFQHTIYTRLFIAVMHPKTSIVCTYGIAIGGELRIRRRFIKLYSLTNWSKWQLAQMILSAKQTRIKHLSKIGLLLGTRSTCHDVGLCCATFPLAFLLSSADRHMEMPFLAL